jgi:hypothetical protein
MNSKPVGVKQILRAIIDVTKAHSQTSKSTFRTMKNRSERVRVVEDKITCQARKHLCLLLPGRTVQAVSHGDTPVKLDCCTSRCSEISSNQFALFHLPLAAQYWSTNFVIFSQQLALDITKKCSMLCPKLPSHIIKTLLTSLHRFEDKLMQIPYIQNSVPTLQINSVTVTQTNLLILHLKIITAYWYTMGQTTVLSVFQHVAHSYQ